MKESEIEEAQANGFDPGLAATPVIHTVGAGDTLWAIAREHYITLAGAEPTAPQIIAMINDMGVADPNHIQPGQEITLPASVSQYADVRAVASAEWLSPVAPTGTEVALNGGEAAPAAPLEAGAAALAGTSSLGSVYQLDGLARSVAGALEPAGQAPSPEFVEAVKANLVANNPGIEEGVIAPGKDLTVVLYGGGQHTAIELTTPTIKEHVFHTVMGPPGPGHELVSQDEVYRAFKEANPDFDFRSGLFGIPMPGSATDLAERMIEHGAFNVPEIDAMAVMPQSNHMVLDGWYTDRSDIARDLIRQAYPNGVPDMLDQDAFLSGLEASHPELQQSRFQADGYHFDRTVLTIDGEQAPQQQLVADAGLTQ